MAINTIEAAKIFMAALDQQLIEGATSGWMEGNAGQVMYSGGSEIKIPKMSVNGLADYDRDSGYNQGAITLTYETKTMTMDRGRQFLLDAMTVDETNFVASAANVMSLFQKERIIPEVDAYRYSKIYELAKEKGGREYTPAANTILSTLNSDITTVQDAAGAADLVIVMIIPVREIAARQRFSTKFADSVLRISTLSMKKTDGKTARAYLSGGSSSKRSIELELEQNPLVLGQSEKTVANVLKDLLTVLKTAYFRPFESTIANDPALDAGDYVRLVGGAIDTSRGYATGIITHTVWRYRGKQDIVNVGSAPVLSQISENDTVEAVTMLSSQEVSESTDDEESGDLSGEDIVYAHPTAQSAKKIVPKTAFPPAPIMYTFKPFTNVDPAAGGGFEFKSSDGTAKFEISENGIQLFRKNAANGYRAYIGADTYLTAYVEDSRLYNAVNVLLRPEEFNVSGRKVRPSGVGGVNQYHLYASNGILHGEAHDDDGNNKAQINIASDLVINYGSTYRIYLSEGQLEITGSGENAMSLSLTANGLYVNGKKVLTEE